MSLPSSRTGSCDPGPPRATSSDARGFDLLLGKHKPSLPIPYAADSSSIDIVRLTDGVYDLLYHTSYAERCHRDGQNAGSAWLHGQMDLLVLVPPNTSA